MKLTRERAILCKLFIFHRNLIDFQYYCLLWGSMKLTTKKLFFLLVLIYFWHWFLLLNVLSIKEFVKIGPKSGGFSKNNGKDTFGPYNYAKIINSKHKHFPQQQIADSQPFESSVAGTKNLNYNLLWSFIDLLMVERMVWLIALSFWY